MSQQFDTLFTGGSVLLPGAESPVALGVAVAAGRIAAVGPDADLSALAGPATEVVDLDGGLLLPGFQDAHVHPVMGGPHHARSASCTRPPRPRTASTSSPTTSRPTPTVEWINGGGWAMSYFENGCPSRQALDALVADRPAFLTNRDGHSYWANTRALELAGIDASTPDPVDGRIEREPDGFPAGTLHEGAGQLVNRLLPESTPEDLYRALMAGQDLLLSLGITAWQDAAVGRLFGFEDTYPVYLAAARAGDLKARVIGALWWERDRGAEQIPELVARREGGADRQVRRHQREDHAGRRGRELHRRDAGALPRPPRVRVAQLRAQLRGPDRPAGARHRPRRRRASRCTSTPSATGPSARRSTPSRQPARPTDRATAGTTSPTSRSCTPTTSPGSPSWRPWPTSSRSGAPTSPRWTSSPSRSWARSERRSSTRSATCCASGLTPRGGQRLVGEQPRPDPGDPRRGQPGRAGLATSVRSTRTTASRSPAAVHAYTAGSAYVNHLDDRTGRIQAGYLADLAVLDKDVFAGPREEIADAKVVATYVEGERVYSAG